MGRNIPQTGAPIPEDIVEDIADNYGHDPELVKDLVETSQADMEEAFEEYRDATVIAETESLMVVLSKFHFREEAKWAIKQIEADVDDSLEEDLPSILSEVHHRAIKLGAVRAITGYSSQETTNALSANYPRIIRKPEKAKPTTGSVDVEYRIQYEHGYQAPFHFVARASADVEGEYGTLRIKRTYRAIPDDNSDEDRNEIHVTSEATHVESDTLVADWTDTWSLDDEIHTGPGRIDEYDHALRHWVYENHTADFEVEYEAIERTIQICDECGAYPSAHVKVEQRPINQFDPSIPDTMCNHCYAEFLAGLTMLSQQEAEVYALKESGVSHRQVSESLPNVSESQVGTVMGRVRNKKAKAEEEREQAKRTAELIDE